MIKCSQCKKKIENNLYYYRVQLVFKISSRKQEMQYSERLCSLKCLENRYKIVV